MTNVLAPPQATHPNHEPQAEPWTPAEVTEQIEQFILDWISPESITPELAGRIEGFTFHHRPQAGPEQRLKIHFRDRYHNYEQPSRDMELRFEEYSDDRRIKDRLMIAHLKPGTDYFIGNVTRWDSLRIMEGLQEETISGQGALDSIVPALRHFKPSIFTRFSIQVGLPSVSSQL